MHRSASIHDRLERLASTPRLLIATDFDGTLAPIVSQPELARALPGVPELLAKAIDLPQTCVALVSGRSLSDLRERIGPLDGAWWVGGHGAEISGPHLEHAPDDVSELLDRVAEQLTGAAPLRDGFRHERKEASIAVHYREVSKEAAAAAIDTIQRAIAAPAGLHVRHGKMVLELLAVDVDKGRALEKVRHATGATGVLYLGDDVTDEDAFRVLGEHDVTMKIGDPPTAAEFCVSSIGHAHQLLEQLIVKRAAWCLVGCPQAIQDHSVLTDQRTLAVVTPTGRVVWMCLPRIDGGALFSSLLDGPEVGYWSVTEVGDRKPPKQRYAGNSFTLETQWRSLKVTDYLDGSVGRMFQRAGRTDLIRIIEGKGTVRVEFCPRLDFGRARTRLLREPCGLVIEGGADPIVLYSPGVDWRIESADGSARATAEVALDGGSLALELRCGTRSLNAARVAEPERRVQTARIWTEWAASLRLPRVAPVDCLRSALAIRALAYAPTGAIVAAGTTSLPETVGGGRNWDYRFCWPRDAAVAGAALVRLGNTGIAMSFLNWLLGVVDRCSGPERLRPIYTVTGEELGYEAELSHLKGYRGSAPVRIGNAAAQQVQTDVFGPIVELVYLLAEAGAAISPDHWRLVDSMVAAVERTWRDADHGIWEVRTDKRHHVHSKVMCWLAVDRAVRLADEFVGVRRESWEVLRDAIREDVLARGFDPHQKAFVAAYDVKEPDASALAVGLFGLIAPSDHRFVSTVEFVAEHLLDRGTVYRYRYDDALAGPEGGFHLCTGWLIESLLLIGQQDRALELFESLRQSAGPTGLLTEQWCPNERTGLGNVPQAYSHAAIINAAVALDRGSGGS